MEDFSDSESNTSFPDLNSRNYNLEINDGNPIDHERDHEKIRIEQRFMEMNRQFGELTNLVKTLTEKITSNPREVNGLKTLFTTTEARSDSKSRDKHDVATSPQVNVPEESRFCPD